MKTSHGLDVVWSVAAEPSYQRDYLRLARPVPFEKDWLVLDRTSLLRVTSSGELKARIVCARAGLWDVPVIVGSHIFTLDLVSGLHKLDPSGAEVGCTKLHASPCTGILAVPQSGLWVGVGWTECEVLRIDGAGNITARQAVAQEGGLRHDLAVAYTQSGQRRILISTAGGLRSLDVETGTIFKQLSIRSCISPALPSTRAPGTAWIVERDENAGCCLTHFSWSDARENMVTLSSLPLAAELREATLYPTSDGGVWLAGTTATPDEPLTGSDQVIVLRVSARGEVARALLPVGAAVDAAVDASDRLWVGVNSDEPPAGLPEGYLAVLDGAAELYAQWEPAHGGVGRSCFLSADEAVVCTSAGLQGVRLR